MAIFLFPSDSIVISGPGTWYKCSQFVVSPFPFFLSAVEEVLLNKYKSQDGRSCPLIFSCEKIGHLCPPLPFRLRIKEDNPRAAFSHSCSFFSRR